MKQESQGLEINVIGLGQCGGNIAAEFYKKGYNALALNTSYTDLKALDALPEENRVYIGVDGRNGAGRDMSLGKRSLSVNQSKILNIVQRLLSGADVLLLTAGLGGGTGSNLSELAVVLEPLKVLTSALVTIPTSSESSITKVNAVKSLNSLLGANLGSIILVDNQKILEQSPNISLASFYPKANSAIAEVFNTFNTINEETDAVSLRSFDSEDFKKVFLSSGFVTFGYTTLQSQEPLSSHFLMEKLREVWESTGIIASGFDFASAAISAVILFAPKQVLARSAADVFEKLSQSIKQVTSGAAVYTGIYQYAKDDKPIKLYTMLGKLPLPERVNELLSEAMEEGKQLSQKVRVEIPRLDLSGLDDMALFSSHSTVEPISVKTESKKRSDTERRMLDYDKVIQYLKKEAQPQRRSEVLQLVLEDYSSEDPEIRRKVIETLGEVGDQSVRAVIMKALGDKDKAVQRAAARALEKLSGEKPE
jgi:cell division GTPase FtsZ